MKSASPDVNILTEKGIMRKYCSPNVICQMLQDWKCLQPFMSGGYRSLGASILHGHLLDWPVQILNTIIFSFSILCVFLILNGSHVSIS